MREAERFRRQGNRMKKPAYELSAVYSPGSENSPWSKLSQF